MNNTIGYFLIFILLVPSLTRGSNVDENHIHKNKGPSPAKDLPVRTSEGKTDLEPPRANRALFENFLKAGQVKNANKVPIGPYFNVNGALLTSPGDGRDAPQSNSTSQKEGIWNGLFKLGQYVLGLFEDEDEEEDKEGKDDQEEDDEKEEEKDEEEYENQESQGEESGRAHRMDPWKMLLPLYKGFYLAGLTAAAYTVIKLFIIQAFFVSKLALIIGFYFVLEKVAKNIAAEKSITTRKLIYHNEPQYVFPSEKPSPYGLPPPTYSVTHTTADIEIDNPHHQSLSSGTSEPKAYPYSGFTETEPRTSYDGKSGKGEKSSPLASYSNELKSLALPYSEHEPSEFKPYPSYTQTETPDRYPNHPESNAIDETSYELFPAELIHSSHVEQIPAVLANSYSYSDTSNQASNDQYYYASTSNATSNRTVPDLLSKMPIHVIAADSPASRPIGRRVFRRLPIAHQNKRPRF